MDRKQLLSSKEYWLIKIQIELFNKVNDYLKTNGMSKTDLAKKLGYSKGYISQILNGDSDHRISKLVELSLAIGVVPDIQFKQLDDYIALDKECKNINDKNLMLSLKEVIDNGYIPYKKGGLYKNDWESVDVYPKPESSISA